MNYLIKLARFVSESDQQQIINEIQALLKENALDSVVSVCNDPWFHQRRLIVNTDNERLQLLEKFIKIPGIWEIIQLDIEQAYNSLQDPINSLVEILKDHLACKLTIRVFQGAKFHKKAFLDRWSKYVPQISITNSSNLSFYLEANSSTFRIGRILLSKPFPPRMNIVLILQSPFSRQEIADFLRLGINFQCPVYFTAENHDSTQFIQLVEKAKQMVKGWEKTSYRIFNSMNEAIKDTYPIAFSLWSHQSEIDLVELVKTKLFSNLSNFSLIPLALVFGNEQQGLDLNARHVIPYIFHLGPASSEPMRASQAAAYAFALLLHPYLRKDK